MIVIETLVTDLDGKPLSSTKRSIVARGEGGFAGKRGSSTNIAPPNSARYPDWNLGPILSRPGSPAREPASSR